MPPRPQPRHRRTSRRGKAAVNARFPNPAATRSNPSPFDVGPASSASWRRRSTGSSPATGCPRPRRLPGRFWGAEKAGPASRPRADSRPRRQIRSVLWTFRLRSPADLPKASLPRRDVQEHYSRRPPQWPAAARSGMRGMPVLSRSTEMCISSSAVTPAQQSAPAASFDTPLVPAAPAPRAAFHDRRQVASTVRTAHCSHGRR